MGSISGKNNNNRSRQQSIQRNITVRRGLQEGNNRDTDRPQPSLRQAQRNHLPLMRQDSQATVVHDNTTQARDNRDTDQLQTNHSPLRRQDSEITVARDNTTQAREDEQLRDATAASRLQALSGGRTQAVLPRQAQRNAQSGANNLELQPANQKPQEAKGVARMPSKSPQDERDNLINNAPEDIQTQYVMAMSQNDMEKAGEILNNYREEIEIAQDPNPLARQKSTIFDRKQPPKS